ncbi:MAG TPA: NAD(+)/NADH kinase [Candidatus Acetothermia bacterium]|nr:NAD(+)/NADH kinase [Candidatus Acetothermia bacterium]
MNLMRVYLVAHAAKPSVLKTLAALKQWCQERNIEVVPASTVLPKGDENAIVLALGGDGTVLRAAGLCSQTEIPVLGINLGSLGFLTQATAQELPEILENLLSERFVIEERMRLAYQAGTYHGTVLNDVVITGRGDSPFCEIELSWEDGAVSTLPGDGVILATATGSTAYSLSAGGPVIVPPAACILATPHAPHKLGLRPVVFPPSEVIRMVSRTPSQVIADGDHVADLEPGTEVRVQRAEIPTYLIRWADSPGFFRVLNEKLNWADARPRELNA